MLSEKEVTRSWSRLFQHGEIDAGAFERAEQLLDELRAESPLRHRLTQELEELRKLHSRQASLAGQDA